MKHTTSQYSTTKTMNVHVEGIIPKCQRNPFAFIGPYSADKGVLSTLYEILNHLIFAPDRFNSTTRVISCQKVNTFHFLSGYFRITQASDVTDVKFYHLLVTFSVTVQMNPSWLFFEVVIYSVLSTLNNYKISNGL